MIDFFLMLLYALALGCFKAVFILVLWNWLMPELFGLPMVSIYQAFGIALLSIFLFQNVYKDMEGCNC